MYWCCNRLELPGNLKAVHANFKNLMMGSICHLAILYGKFFDFVSYQINRQSSYKFGINFLYILKVLNILKSCYVDCIVCEKMYFATGKPDLTVFAVYILILSRDHFPLNAITTALKCRHPFLIFRDKWNYWREKLCIEPISFALLLNKLSCLQICFYMQWWVPLFHRLPLHT